MLQGEDMDGLVGALLFGSLESVLFGGDRGSLLSRGASLATLPSGSDGAEQLYEAQEECLEISSADEDAFEAHDSLHAPPIPHSQYVSDTSRVHNLGTKSLHGCWAATI